MDINEIQYQITTLLREEIQGELQIRRPARAYDGRYKPVSKTYPTPQSKKSLTGSLSNSVNVYFKGSMEDNNLTLVVDFGSNDYWYYVDQGRKPGDKTMKRRQARRKNGQFGRGYWVEDYTKYPPLASIAQWVRQRPALEGVRDIDTRTYLAARSIAKYGIYGIKFIDSALKDVEDRIVELFGDMGQELFLQIIDKKIILPTQEQ
jgi:hypothetical protein